MRHCYQTEQDGYCEFDTLEEAQRAADHAAVQNEEQVEVFACPQTYPRGPVVYRAGINYPTHESKCLRPEVYGFED